MNQFRSKLAVQTESWFSSHKFVVTDLCDFIRHLSIIFSIPNCQKISLSVVTG
jgi:hypothetical protein